jgi:hypothetical protein
VGIPLDTHEPLFFFFFMLAWPTDEEAVPSFHGGYGLPSACRQCFQIYQTLKLARFSRKSTKRRRV